jgi:hypothetical protein
MPKSIEIDEVEGRPDILPIVVPPKEDKPAVPPVMDIIFDEPIYTEEPVAAARLERLLLFFPENAPPLCVATLRRYNSDGTGAGTFDETFEGEDAETFINAFARPDVIQKASAHIVSSGAIKNARVREVAPTPKSKKRSAAKKK